ncbi:MAG TPA: FAD-dependent oxidoreductase [Actinomycetota bacterium]|nr:FAD-dependent oxidoreductase [Actinomycetota bacterium]
MRDVDAIVVGGGVMGTSAARWLAARGRETLVLERFEIGNAFGSSAGPTRIFRLAHPEPEDVRMARVALELWRELEDEARETLLHPTGGLFAGPIAREWTLALEAAGERAAPIAAAEVGERWPAITFAPGTDVLWQDEGGVLMAERVVRAQARLAVAAGATVLEWSPVERVVATGLGAEVGTLDEVFRAPIVVIAAGPWVGGLLEQAELQMPLTPRLTQVTYFEQADPSPLPTLIDRSVASPPDAYVVPDPEEPGSVKVGADLSGPPVDPEAHPFEPHASLVEATIAYAGDRLGEVRAGRSEALMLTETPDGRFLLDRRGPVVIASPCNGRGFKFAPLIGRIVADLAMARPAPIPIERFLAARFGA